jgi:hypothetical protein
MLARQFSRTFVSRSVSADHLRSATIAINGTTQTFAPAIPDDKQAILDAIQGAELTR